MFKKKDPVCGIKVSGRSKYFLGYGGKIYYFDSHACRETFKDNPQRFVQKKCEKRGLALWLARGSEDVPKSCHEIKSGR